METMTAGAWEGVDLMGLMQIWSHPHPPQFSSLISQNLHWIGLWFLIWRHTLKEGNLLEMVWLGGTILKAPCNKPNTASNET